MAWIWLIAAGVLEVGFATCLKLADGFTRPLWTVLFVIFAAASFYGLTRAMQDIPIGTAYAVWTGIGAAGTVALGIAFFNEPATAARLGFLTLLIVSIVGLKIVSGEG